MQPTVASRPIVSTRSVGHGVERTKFLGDDTDSQACVVEPGGADEGDVPRVRILEERAPIEPGGYGNRTNGADVPDRRQDRRRQAPRPTLSAVLAGSATGSPPSTAATSAGSSVSANCAPRVRSSRSGSCHPGFDSDTDDQNQRDEQITIRWRRPATSAVST